MSITKRLCKSLRPFVIIQIVEPIGELAESVFEARTPFGVTSLRLLLEDAILAAVFKLHDAEFAGVLVAQEQVGREVAKERELKSQFSRWANVR